MLGMTKSQSPSLPWPLAAVVQATHLPPQLELQQTPSTQFPVEHSKPFWQAVPFPLVGTQLPERRSQYVLAPAHSAWFAQA
jgi:hypothetical protein